MMPAAHRSESPATASVRHGVLAAVISVAVLLCAGCAPHQNPTRAAAEPTSSRFAGFAASSDEEQLRSVTESGRALDDLVSGTIESSAERKEESGADPVESAQGLTVMRASVASASAASGARVTSARGGADAPESAFHDLAPTLQLIDSALTGIDGNQEGYAASAPDDDVVFDWRTSHGSTSGSLAREEMSQEGGTDTARTISTQFSASACPSPDGIASAVVALESAVTTTSASGVTTRTRVDVDFAFDVTVGDTAYAEDMLVDLQGSMTTGSPGPGADVSKPARTLNAKGRLSFGFGADGVAGMTDYANSVTPSKKFDRALEDLAGKAALRLAAQLEEYWRSGACVGISFDHPSEVAAGSTTDLGVEPISKADGGAIDDGTVALLSIEGDGRVTPEGEEILPATFAWIAPGGPGGATLTFVATSNRGVGTDSTSIEVVQAWEITGTKDGAVHHGIKCDGLVGAWSMDATGDYGFAYTAHIEFDLDTSLVGAYSAAMTMNGKSLNDAGQIWLEKVDDQHYTLHADPYDVALQVTATDACER